MTEPSTLLEVAFRNFTYLVAVALTACGITINGDASALIGIWSLGMETRDNGTRTIVLDLPSTDPTQGTRGLITGSPSPGTSIYCPIYLTSESDGAVRFVDAPGCDFATGEPQNSHQTATGTVTLTMNRVVLSLTLTSSIGVVTQIDASAQHY